MKARIMAKNGNFAQAFHEYQVAYKNKDDSWAHTALGIDYFNNGNKQAAIREMMMAIQINPENDRAYLNMGNLFALSGNFQQAIVYFKKALSIDSDCLDAHNNLGRAYMREGKFNEALSEFRQTVRISPSSVESRQNMVLALIRLGMTADALNELTQILATNPRDAKSHMLLGQVHFSNRHFESAYKEFLYATGLDSTNPEAFYHLGCTFYEMERWDDAIGSLKRALEIDSDFPGVHNKLLSTYSKKRLKEYQ